MKPKGHDHLKTVMEGQKKPDEYKGKKVTVTKKTGQAFLKALKDKGHFLDKIKPPPPPTYDKVAGETALHQEQQVLRCEILMVKGVRQPTQLMQLLDVSNYELTNIVARVHARWELMGTRTRHNSFRGEGLVRLDLVEQKLWSEIEKIEASSKPETDTMGKIISKGSPRKHSLIFQGLKHITEVQQQRNQLAGLTPKALEQIALQMAFGDTEEEDAFAVAKEDKIKTQAAAKKLLGILATMGEDLESETVEAEVVSEETAAEVKADTLSGVSGLEDLPTA